MYFIEGFSNQFHPGKKLFTSCGSLAYSAPEILLGDPYDAPAVGKTRKINIPLHLITYSHVDIWSLGVILFMLVTGRAPFQEANDSETVMMILDCSYKLPPNVSIECQKYDKTSFNYPHPSIFVISLVHRMIVRDPEKRATLSEVMSDVWYRQTTEDEDEIDPSKSISKDAHNYILRQMISGNIAEFDAIEKALHEDQYNHIAATYHLLAEKILFDECEEMKKEKRRVLQPANDPFTEKIGGCFSSIPT